MSEEKNYMNQELECINVLIDNQEIAAHEAALDKLIELNEFPYEIEESKVFAKRIIKQEKKGDYTMKKSVAAASIIEVCLLSATAAYASGLFSKFTFSTEHGIAIVRTTENITNEPYSFLKVDISKQEYGEGTSIYIASKISDETYTTLSDIEYEIAKEKDEVAKTTCLTAKAYVGEYEYGIFTNGIEETAFYNILDSADLSIYKLTED